MLVRKLSERVSWPLCLTIVFCIVLLRAWYFSAGNITFGDFYFHRSESVLPDAFHFWVSTDELGRADSAYWWQRAALGLLFSLHINSQFAERVVWLYLWPLVFIVGLYTLAKALTHDRTAAGVASLVGFLNAEYLFRLIGGHEDAVAAIGLSPWVLFAVFSSVRTGRASWLALTTITLAIATAYDARWSLPVFAIAFVIAIIAPGFSGGRHWPTRAFTMASLVIGLVLPELPWLTASVLSHSALAPGIPSSYADPAWVRRLSFATLNDGIAIWNPAFASDFNGGPIVIRHLQWWLSIPFFGCVVFSVALARRVVPVTLFVLYLIGVMLYKGTQPPGGQIYLWAFQHLPLFNLYREPLKWGAAAALCASFVIAFGIASLRGTQQRLAGAMIVCVLMLAMSAPAFEKGGTLTVRVPDSAYDTVQRLIGSDKGFSRVLWLPQMSRWTVGTAVHPAADGQWLGMFDWSHFQQPVALGADASLYAVTPLFETLLRWNSFGYVVVDCSTEQDATFRSDSFTCIHVLQSLLADRGLQAIAATGPLHVFRVIGRRAPALWSASFAPVASGWPSAINAGAMTGLFKTLTPVILQRDVPPRLNIQQPQLVFDGAVRVRSIAPNVQRIVGANSVDFGTMMGDAIIQHQPLLFRNVRLRKVAYGQSTIAYAGTLAVATLATKLRPLRKAISLGPSSDVSVDHNSYGLQIIGISIPIYDKPALSIVGMSTDHSATYIPLLELQGYGHRYVLAGSPVRSTNLPVPELDIRDLLFRTVASNGAATAFLAANDRFDALRLVGVRLLRRGAQNSSLLRVSIGVRAREAFGGYPVKSAVIFPASGFSCVCSRDNSGRLVFRRFGERYSGWKTGIVAIHASPDSYTGVIQRSTSKYVTGISSEGNLTFVIRRDRILSTVPAPDSAMIDLGVAGSAIGVLVLRGSVDPRARAQVLLRSRAGLATRWFFNDLSTSNTGVFTARIDLLAAAHVGGYQRIDKAYVVLTYRNPRDRGPINAWLSDAIIARNFGQSKAQPTLHVGKSVVVTTLSPGRVPLAARFGDQKSLRDQVVAHNIKPSVNAAFQDKSRNKWLIFSEHFDPGWKLVHSDSSPVAAEHLRVYGSLNAWYIPSGLHGEYRVVYPVDTYARIGGLITISALCACLIFMGLGLSRFLHDSVADIISRNRNFQ